MFFHDFAKSIFIRPANQNLGMKEKNISMLMPGMGRDRTEMYFLSALYR